MFKTVLVKADKHIGSLSSEPPRSHRVLSVNKADAIVVALPGRLSIPVSNLPEPVPLHLFAMEKPLEPGSEQKAIPCGTAKEWCYYFSAQEV